MALENIIISRLAATFLAKFAAEKKSDCHCVITVAESEERYFSIDVLIREQNRLIITVCPEKHAADFVQTINECSIEKRRNFCTIWEKLEGKLKIKINDIEISRDMFLQNDIIWRNFSFRLSVPLYDDEIDKEDKAAELTCSMCNLVLSLVDYNLVGEVEGTIKETISAKHIQRERSAVNRSICLQLKGYNCAVCGMNFGDMYGDIGKNYIQIHHSIPIHLMEEEHEVVIDKELFPVCANCHAMLHRKDPPYTIEELRELVFRQHSDKE